MQAQAAFLPHLLEVGDDRCGHLAVGRDHIIITMMWTERGGPAVRPPEGTEGYGSRMVSRVLANQLSGTIERDWSPEGAIITVRMNKERVAA